MRERRSILRLNLTRTSAAVRKQCSAFRPLTAQLQVVLHSIVPCKSGDIYQLLFVSSTIECLHFFVIAPDDYKSVNKCFPFEPGMNYSVETIDDATPEPNECFDVMIGPFPGASNVNIGKNTTATVCVCDSSSEYAVMKYSCYVMLICAVLYNYRCLVFGVILGFSCTEVQLCVTVFINACGLRTCYRALYAGVIHASGTFISVLSNEQQNLLHMYY